jgi:hypothetical protein
MSECVLAALIAAPFVLVLAVAHVGLRVRLNRTNKRVEWLTGGVKQQSADLITLCDLIEKLNSDVCRVDTWIQEEIRRRSERN